MSNGSKIDPHKPNQHVDLNIPETSTEKPKASPTPSQDGYTDVSSSDDRHVIDTSQPQGAKGTNLYQNLEPISDNELKKIVNQQIYSLLQGIGHDARNQVKYKVHVAIDFNVDGSIANRHIEVTVDDHHRNLLSDPDKAIASLESRLENSLRIALLKVKLNDPTIKHLEYSGSLSPNS